VINAIGYSKGLSDYSGGADSWNGLDLIFKPEPYKQPENKNSQTPTQQQLKTFINENGSATKIDKP
jgi:hypothetical protein